MKKQKVKLLTCGLLACSLMGFTSPKALAKMVKLDVSLGQDILLANTKQTTFLKIGLTGFEIKDQKERTPVNIAFVIDRSGSMTGEKIEQAKEATIMAIDRLSKNDIISVIAYDDTVNILMPATKVTNKDEIKSAIKKLAPGGSTALFAGVSKGSAEVKKFLNKNKVNRVILLSDGLANIGPSSPGELAELGSSLIKDRISVTTIGLGLGYNEDLMVRLATTSDGNHAFVENPKELAKIFDHEFGDVLSVVAQEVLIKIRCENGIRPIRVLGRDAEISGQNVVISLNQLYSNQEKYVLLEVEVPKTETDTTRKIANVNISYANMITNEVDKLNGSVSTRFSNNKKLVKNSEDKKVMIETVTLVANEKNKMALDLRDKGKKKEASELLKENASYLQQKGVEYESPKLREMGTSNVEESGQVLYDDSSSEYKRTRKSMKMKQKKADTQQKW